MEYHISIVFVPGTIKEDAVASLAGVAVAAGNELGRRNALMVDETVYLKVNSPYVDEASISRVE